MQMTTFGGYFSNVMDDGDEQMDDDVAVERLFAHLNVRSSFENTMFGA